MNKYLPAFLRSLILSGVLLILSHSAFATHIVGAELRYKWVTGLTYEVTVYLYGDCGSTSGAFGTLPTSRPEVCVYNGNTYFTTLTLSTPSPSAGTEVTPVCPDSLGFTNCTSLSYTIPGIKKFVCTGTVTLPTTSAVWRFIYDGNNPGGSQSGRSLAITNINTLSGAALIQLIDTLNNSATNTRGHNSSPVLTVEPIPFFCFPYWNCYNPGAVDLFDVSPTQPAGDSLVFSLIAATNGTGTCSSIGGAASYISTVCPGGPTTSGGQPLSLVDCTPASFSFDAATGQLCFEPVHAFQRSVVVYNVREYRDDSISPGVINHVLVGTLQREMTFLVKPCVYTTPVGKIDSFSGAGDTLSSYHYYSCANSGTFTLNMNPTEPDTSLHITCTATGLSTGFVFSVTGDGTSSPHVTVTGNTALILPGTYVFYLTFTDNHCPLVGTKTYAFTVDILPVPSITGSVITPATCNDKAVVQYVPGGTGKPWTVKISHNPSILPLSLDTFHVFAFDTTTITDSLSPGKYYITIFTSVSNLCSYTDSLLVDTPHFSISVTGTNPTYCGAPDGSLVLHGLNPTKADTLIYKFQGTLQTRIPFVSSTVGTDTLFGRLAGFYDSMVVQEGFCFTDPPVAISLFDPPFTWRTVTTVDATKKCFCDGELTLWGLHPGQLDTVTFTFVPAPIPGGPTTTPTYSRLIGADSQWHITGLCAGTYSNFTVKTAGVCSYTIPGPFVINQPNIVADFDSAIHFGCNGDTVLFTNLSTPASELTYRWIFGDGYTDTATNPIHVYTNTTSASYVVRLFISNSRCIDSSVSTINLDNFVNSDFTFTPTPFVCQGSPVTFTNTSTGTNLTYMWDFGDGFTDLTTAPTHTFANTGTYKIKLISADHILPAPVFPHRSSPCYDTVTKTIEVDSISSSHINMTDSVICLGEAITFTGVYSTIGDTAILWSFGDNNMTANRNPIQHAYDAPGTYTVQIDVKYRACPPTSSTRSVLVFGTPNIYLGPDTAICPGSKSIVLADEHNAGDPKARWKWSTGEKTPSIVVTKPGYYSTVVTINGCSASDTVWVQRDCYVDIPNVFTPNEDGTNDYFFPRQLLSKGLVEFKMSIYNRWGQLIYETDASDGRGWDGRFNGKPQPEGVYVFIIDAKFKDGQIEHHQGNITLLR